MSAAGGLRGDFDPTIVAAVEARLSDVFNVHGAKILLAVESGSRAWGFPSPDSDYDCRFIYVRKPDDYFTLYLPRDVIEFPPDPILDVNGWDLAKTLRLLLKNNAVVIEWLTSPLVYSVVPNFREEALALARQITNPAMIAWHYFHVGDRQRRTHLSEDEPVGIKKIFYVLRPALVLRWLRLHEDEKIAPMHFPTLVSQSDLPSDLVTLIADLIARKATITERGIDHLPPRLGELIATEFNLATAQWPRDPGPLHKAHIEAADGFLRRWSRLLHGEKP